MNIYLVVEDGESFCIQALTMYAAIEIAKRIKSGIIVVIFPDRGEKYLSTELFEQ